MLRILATSVSTSNAASRSKYAGSYQYRIDVPVLPRVDRPVTRNPSAAVNFACGPGPPNTPATPCLNDTSWTLPSRRTAASRRSDSALTTAAPTPCSPPEVL